MARQAVEIQSNDPMSNLTVIWMELTVLKVHVRWDAISEYFPGSTREKLKL